MSIAGRAIVGAWISQRHRTGDSACTISNDRDCWRRLMAGTTLAGGLAVASVAAGPAAAHDHDHDDGGGILHCGLLDGLLNNSGAVTNNCIHTGALNNTGAAAAVTNSALGTWIGNLLTNIGGTHVYKLGTTSRPAKHPRPDPHSVIWTT